MRQHLLQDEDDPYDDYTKRRAELQETFYFHCQCPKCVLQEAGKRYGNDGSDEEEGEDAEVRDNDDGIVDSKEELKDEDVKQQEEEQESADKNMGANEANEDNCIKPPPAPSASFARNERSSKGVGERRFVVPSQQDGANNNAFLGMGLCVLMTVHCSS